MDIMLGVLLGLVLVFSPCWVYSWECKFGANDLMRMDFEDGISGWTKTGTAFNNQPTYGDNPTARNRGQPAKQQGNYWIGGYENRPGATDPAGQIQGDKPTGTLTSPVFRITCNTLSFLIGGGCDISKVRVELLIDGRVAKKETGRCTETMERRYWDVSGYKGKVAQVRLVDHSSEGWGHINFDDLNYVPDFMRMDFENGISGWTNTGTAFNNQPTYGDNPTARNRGQPAKQQGNYWIGGYENRPGPSHPAGQIQGDKPTGTLTSPVFRITCNTLSFLIGGGCDISKVRVELLIDGRVAKKETGRCTETMERRSWDVSGYQNKVAQVRLVDNSSEGWGHINFDDLSCI